jgi:hypothetical protein
MQMDEKSTWHQGSHNCFINTKLSPNLAMLNHAPKLTHVLEIHPLEQNCQCYVWGKIGILGYFQNFNTLPIAVNHHSPYNPW